MPVFPLLWAVFIVAGSLWTAKQAARLVVVAALGVRELVNWIKIHMATRFQNLGINPSRPDFTPERMKRAQEEMNELFEQLGVALGEAPIPAPSGPPEHVRFVRFTFEEEDLPKKLKWMAGKYVLTVEEHKQLESALRALEILYQEGPSAERLMGICEKYGVPYEELAPLWSELGIDTLWLQELSKRRQADAQFMGILDNGGAQFH